MSVRAFSLIEVLISIVVLALGLLGIAAVFPAVVTQQRATTDSVQGGSLQESVRQYITTHRLLNRPSVKLQADGTVARADLRGWQLLLDNPDWSPPVNVDAGLLDGDFEVPGTNITASGLNIDTTTGIMWMLNADATAPSTPLPPPPAVPDSVLLNEPIAWIHITERQLPVWATGRSSTNVRPDAKYVWDLAARRVNAGAPIPRSGTSRDTSIEQRRSYQDDVVQLAVFIRRKDKPAARFAADPRVLPVAQDTNGRPTFDGMGEYSRIREAVYTIEGFNNVNDPTNWLRFDGLTNARYVAQVGQKLVDQWGEVHDVIESELISDTSVRVKIRATTQRADEGVKAANAWAYMQASVTLNMVFTDQIPASVSVFNVRPQPIPRN